MKFNFSMRFLLIFNFLFFLSLLSCSSELFGQATDSVIFRDDFNGNVFGSSWNADESWSVRDGSAHNFTEGPGGTLVSAAGYADGSYFIETRAMGFNNNYYREFRLTFGQADLSDRDHLYELSYTAWGGPTLTLGKSVDNVFYPETLDDVAFFPELSSSRWYKFKIARYKSGLIQVYMDKGSGYDSIPILEAIDTAYPALGHFGWQVDTDAFPEDFFVDWISAGKPAFEKPAIPEKPAEDDLITQVSAASGSAYSVSKLIPGVKQLIDRDYSITSLPEYLKGASFIQTANADKFNAADSFLTFFVKTSDRAIAYVGYDARATEIPEWLKGWRKTGDTIGLSDSQTGGLSLYSKLFDHISDRFPFPVVLGGNLATPATGAGTNYLVAVTKAPRLITLQAEDAALSGVVVATNHINYNGTGFADFKNPYDDYIEWTVTIDVPGTYALDFKFANASPRDRYVQCSSDGVNYGMIAFPHDTFHPSWDSWSFLSGPKIFLSAGVHKIKIAATGTSGPNIDELSLFFISAAPVTLSSLASSEKMPDKKISLQITVENSGAYPNPFLQSTKIYYHLKEKAKVILGIYTLQGQRIQLLENSMRNPGNYQATFNSGKYAKGIYFYRLQAGDEVRTGKLIKD